MPGLLKLFCSFAFYFSFGRNSLVLLWYCLAILAAHGNVEDVLSFMDSKSYLLDSFRQLTLRLVLCFVASNLRFTLRKEMEVIWQAVCV